MAGILPHSDAPSAEAPFMSGEKSDELSAKNGKRVRSGATEPAHPATAPPWTGFQGLLDDDIAAAAAACCWTPRWVG